MLLLQACAQGDMPCRVGADCPSGVCLIDGLCRPAELDGALPDGALPDGAPRDSGRSDGGPADAAALDAQPGDAGDAGRLDGGAPDAGPCGHDGTITRAELPLPLSTALVRRVATNVAVDTAGAMRADGSRLWDFEGPYSGDADRTDQRMPLAGAWYAEDFPDATYVLPLGVDDDLLGVFRLTDSALSLVGVVSAEDGVLSTRLRYDPPAPVWRFPLEVGASWEGASTVSGRLNGGLSSYRETWRVEVDAAGELGTPAGVRRVLRVNTDLTRTVGLVVTRSRRHAYVEECVGTVAQVFGRDGDTRLEPDHASEIWRVAP